MQCNTIKVRILDKAYLEKITVKAVRNYLLFNDWHVEDMMDASGNFVVYSKYVKLEDSDHVEKFHCYEDRSKKAHDFSRGMNCVPLQSSI